MRRSILFIAASLATLAPLALSLALEGSYGLSLASVVPALLLAAAAAYGVAVFARSLAAREAARLASALREGRESELDEMDFEALRSLAGQLKSRTRLPLPAAPAPNLAANAGLQATLAAEREANSMLRSQKESLRGGLSDLASQLELNLDHLKKAGALVMDIGQNIQTMAGQSREAALKNDQLLRTAEKDGELIATEIQTLMSVKEALEAGTAVIDDLQASSREVGGVIESIYVIARKTNMLALNAAIEAARAGEQGKGFAVVAEEVRKLAEAATLSTQKVERFIESLREKTGSAIEVLKGAGRIEETIPVVYRISDAFINIVPAVDASQKSLADLGGLVQENIEEIRHMSEILTRSSAATEATFSRTRDLLDSMD